MSGSTFRGRTNTMECFNGDLEDTIIQRGGFSAELTTTPVEVTFLSIYSIQLTYSILDYKPDCIRVWWEAPCSEWDGSVQVGVPHEGLGLD